MSEDLKFLVSLEIMSDFFNFYNELASQVFNLDIENEELLKQLKSVRFRSFDKNTETKIMKSDIKFADEIVRCAYLLKYSVINSYCVFDHFQNVYICDSSLFNQLKEMKTARICCFGGGAGIELFAICQVISEFLRNNSNEEHQYSIKLCFTVIDVYNEWESWIFSLVKELRKCNKDVIDVRLRFIQANVTDEWGEDVLKAVQKADILTMVKFLSALNLNEDDYEKKKDLKLLENVACKMKLDSWIFFLDFAGGGYYKKMQKKMKRQYFQQCQAFLHQKYSVDKNKLEVSRPFSSFMLSVMSRKCDTKVSSGTWQKCIPKLVVKKGKPKKVKKIKTYKKLPSASAILKEQMEAIDAYYEVLPDCSDSDKVKEIEAEYEGKEMEIHKKSGVYIVKVKT